MFLPIGDDINKRSFPVVGTYLIAANVLIYMYTTRVWYDALPSGTAWVSLIETWGLVPARVPRGQVHPLLTYMFLHGSLSHILGNMVVLWAFVGTLEDALGPKRFLGLYILWGFVGGVAHAAMNFTTDLPMIGASGAIAGMIGAYFVGFGALTNIRMIVWIITPMRVSMPAGAFVALWFCSQLMGVSAELEIGRTGVAWFAHLGGFAAGAITMKTLGKDVRARLVLNRAGTLELKPVASAEVQSEGTAALVEAECSEQMAAPAACPHCESPLEQENRIHDTLMQCPNPSCKRLIYLGT